LGGKEKRGGARQVVHKEKKWQPTKKKMQAAQKDQLNRCWSPVTKRGEKEKLEEIGNHKRTTAGEGGALEPALG